MKICHPMFIAILSCALALYFRVAEGSVVRELITSMLGPELRAIIEHLLSGFGVPLILAFLILIATKGREQRSSDEEILMGVVFVIFALAYVGGSYGHEMSQAVESVYGGAPRGYFQYAQWFADIIGVCLAAMYTYFFVKGHHRHGQRKSFKFRPDEI